MDELHENNIKIVYDETVLKPLENEIETRKYKYSENKNNKGTYEITGFTHRGSYNIVNFPNTINGLPVTKIAFDYSLETETDEIIIPENVESIEKMPLVNKKITVSENNKYFSSDGYALYDKDKTKLYAVYVVDKNEYIIPDTVIEITKNAFTWCEKLTKLHIPNSVKIIGDKAFNYCTKLKEITGGNNVISVGKEAFKETAWYKTNDILVLGKILIKSNLLTKVVTIPNDVEIIGTESFAILDSCWNVDDKTEEIIIPETIKNIEAGAFKNRRKLERITLPQCLKTIPSNLFENCSNLKEIVIPNNVKVIEKEAFERCTSLVNITLPDSLTEIKEEAFYQCESLEQIIIPNSVTKIGESAFNECVNLKTINLPDTLKKISSSLFSSCKNLESINIPCNLETIGSYAFNSCEKIKEIILPDSLKVIEAAAFRGCLSIESIRIPKQVKGVYNYSFPDTVIYPYRLRKELNCSFKTIEVDEENPYYKSINGILYTKDLKTLVSVPAKWDKNIIFSIPQEVEKIEKYAIKNNRTIKKIIIPDSVKEISESAISECLNLEEVVLPKNLEKIPKYLLAGCSKLIRISWPDNLKEIGEAAFSGTGLKVINIPETVTTIDDYALSYTNANKITIPKSVKNIGLSICAGTSEIEVYDSIDDNAKPAKEYIDNCNGTPNSNVGWMGICKNKMYTVCAASPNTIWHNHTIIVKSKETDKIKYRVPMNGIDEARTYYCMLTSSWGKNAEFNFYLLDKAFTKIKNMRYKIKLAISRLEDNYELTDGIRKMYESYLKKSGVKIVKYYIDINDLNTLKILEKYEVITKINIDKAIEYAQEKHNTTIVSYLKDYKNKII